MTAIRPPTTAPLLFIAFATSHVLFYVVKLGFNLLEPLSSAVAYDVIGMLVPGIFVWIAGTFPLQAVRVAHNIAGSKDVCTTLTYALVMLTLSSFEGSLRISYMS